MNLSNEIKITKVAAAAGAATDAITGSEVDMSGYDGVLFFTTIHVANAGNYIKAQQDTATGMASAADLEGSKVVCAHADDILWIDVYKPQERFVRCVTTRGSSSAASEMFAIQYKGDKRPEDNDVANLIDGVLLVSPDEGTA